MKSKLNDVDGIMNPKIIKAWHEAYDASEKKSKMPDKHYGFPAQEGSLRATMTEVLGWDIDAKTMKYGMEMILNHLRNEMWKHGDSRYEDLVLELEDLTAICTMFLLHVETGNTLAMAIQAKSEMAALMGNVFKLEEGYKHGQ